MQILRIVYIYVLERLQRLFLSHSLSKSKQKNSFQIFAQNNGLTPLEKWKICDFLNSVFLFSRKASCLSRTSPNTFNNPNLPKGNDEETLNFCLKPWTNLFEKMENLRLF